jgi:AcrR family transcriptional regulator
MTSEKSVRRRGAALEKAILDAAWRELAADGYAAFTMEAVASRAQTSRSVIARRWPDRANLTLAAILHLMATHPLTVPDLGSLRAEMQSLMRQSRDRGLTTGLLAMLQMGDYVRETGVSPGELKHDLLEGESGPLATILARGIDRGEIDAQKLTPRIMSLVPDLLRHEMIMSRGAVSDEVIDEVIDSIFLPLVSPAPSR